MCKTIVGTTIIKIIRVNSLLRVDSSYSKPQERRNTLTKTTHHQCRRKLINKPLLSTRKITSTTQ